MERIKTGYEGIDLVVDLQRKDEEGMITLQDGNHEPVDITSQVMKLVSKLIQKGWDAS